jgi:hypothetical protein
VDVLDRRRPGCIVGLVVVGAEGLENEHLRLEAPRDHELGPNEGSSSHAVDRRALEEFACGPG